MPFLCYRVILCTVMGARGCCYFKGEAALGRPAGEGRLLIMGGLIVVQNILSISAISVMSARRFPFLLLMTHVGS